MGLERRIRRHRKSKSSPGIFAGKRHTDSFDSSDGSPVHDDRVLIWPGINENLKKNYQSDVINIRNFNRKHSTELPEQYQRVNGEEKDENPTFSPKNPSSFDSSLSSNLPPSSSDTYSALPSSSYSNSSNDLRNLILGDTSKIGLEDPRLTIPIPDKMQATFAAHLKSLMQSPFIQVMDRGGGGYDPHRIPSTIFETSRSSTPVEWSVASNESLFSINLGRSNSLAAEPILSWGDLVKAGEAENRSSAILIADADNQNSISVHESYEPTMELELNKCYEPAMELQLNENEENGVADGHEKNEVKIETIDVNVRDEKRICTVASLRYQDLAPAASIQTKALDEGGDSNHSFAFPVLGDGPKTVDPIINSPGSKSAEQCPSPRPPRLLVAPTPARKPASRCCLNCFPCRPCCFSSCCLFRSCSYHTCSDCSCHNFSCSSCFKCTPRMCSCSSCLKCTARMCSCSSCFCFKQSSCCSCHQWSCSSSFSCRCSSGHRCSWSSCFPCSGRSSCHPCSCSSPCLPCSSCFRSR